MSTGKLMFPAIASIEKFLPPKGELNLFIGPQNSGPIGASNGGSAKTRRLLRHIVMKRANGSFCVGGSGFDCTPNK